MPRNPNKKDYSGGFSSNLDTFSIIEDPRTGVNKKHHFGEILFMGAAHRIVLNIVKADQSLKKKLPKKRFYALMDIAYREKLLSLSLA